MTTTHDLSEDVTETVAERFACYFDVADELYDDGGTRFDAGFRMTLEDLDDTYLIPQASAFAVTHHAPWPPELPWAEEWALSHRDELHRG